MLPVWQSSFHLFISSVFVSGLNGPKYEMTAARERASPLCLTLTSKGERENQLKSENIYK